MNKVDLLADEELIIVDGGEIPEVTFHSSLYYLTEDRDGPQIDLDREDLLRLKKAVIGCYKRIMLRDLTLENRDKGLYRGLERCRLNWQRLIKFCHNESLDYEHVREDIVRSLKKFLAIEVTEVCAGRRASSINCSDELLDEFFNNLKLAPDELPKGWRKICP